MSYEFFLATRYLRRRRDGFISLIAGFSFLGIALGVATLIIVLSVMNGFRQKLLGKILEFNSHVTLFAQGKPLGDYDAIIKKLRPLKGVKGVTPLIEEQAMVIYEKESAGVMIRGMSPSDLNARLQAHMVDGSITDLVMGQRLALKMGIKVGDTVTLLAPQGTQTPFGWMPKLKAFRVGGVFDVGMSEYNRGFVFMPLADAQSFFKKPGNVSAIEIFLDHPDDIKPQVKRLQRALGLSSVVYMDWQQNNASFFEAVTVERNVMFIILTLIILIAAFNIISGLVMLVNEKVSSIGILLTMGASRLSIMRIFFYVGSTIGVVGTALGVGLGLAFSLNIEAIRRWIEGLSGWHLFQEEIYFLSHLPAVVDRGEVLMVVSISLTLSFLATLYPSFKAARLSPVEALRHG